MEKGKNDVNKSIGIPIGIEFEKWKFLVRGLKQLKANIAPVNGKEIETLTKINYTTISSNVKFLHQIDFITKESKTSSLQLSSKGLEFVDSLIMQNEIKQKEILTPLLKESCTDLLAFYDLHMQNQDLDFDMLFNQIKLLSESPDISGQPGNTYPMNKIGINTLINMLIFTKLVDEKFNPKSNGLKTLKEKSGQPRSRSEIPLRCSMEWLKRFFTAISKMNPTKISREFITANVTANNHESKILSVARFLEIIDKEGIHSKNYEKLRIYGTDEFATNLAEILKEKYKKIFSITDMATAEQKNVQLVFMKEYNLGNDQAHNSLHVLTDLCQLANIPLSESLLSNKKPGAGKSFKPQIKQPQKNSNTHIQNEQLVSPTIIQPQISDSPFKINLNYNIEIKDKESLENGIDLIRRLKREIRITLPELDIKVNEESLD